MHVILGSFAYTASMNLIRPFGLVVALVLAIAAGYVGRAVSEEQDSTTSESSSSMDSDVELTIEALREQGPQYSIDVEYCQVGLSTDTFVKQIVDAEVASFKNAAQGQPPLASGRYSMSGSCDAAYVSTQVVSYHLTLYKNLGGAHGASRINGLNYDRATGRELTLDDALSMVGLSLTQVAEQAAVQLSTKQGLVPFPEGASADAKNYQTFLIGADRVRFFFQEYQVASYAEGPQEVWFPKSPISR